jgi:hypothetical protein
LAEPAGGIANPTAGRTEVKMTAVAGLDRDRPREAAMLCFQLLQARLAGGSVDIEHKDAGRGASGDKHDRGRLGGCRHDRRRGCRAGERTRCTVVAALRQRPVISGRAVSARAVAGADHRNLIEAGVRRPREAQQEQLQGNRVACD